MFAIVSNAAHAKVIIFVEQDEVSEGECSCMIQTYCVATLTSCADVISSVPNRLLRALLVFNAEEVFYASRLADYSGYYPIGVILPPGMAKECMFTWRGTRSAQNVDCHCPCGIFGG